MILIAAVQPVGNVAQFPVVLGDVGIQEQQGNPAHLGNPDASREHPVLRHRHRDQDRRAVLMRQQPQRQAGGVDERVLLGLPAIGGQRLPEVAGPVVQPHRDERQTQIGRGLEVIAGKDAQTTGVVR
ncbi:Uncharacterised protein [Mycobacteroides abscessus subsp. massiliense]|nr:Uncharacterised protein [Mycobacteroides abscessus subsp. massiliense]